LTVYRKRPATDRIDLRIVRVEIRELPPKPAVGMPIDKTDDWERRQDERRDPGAGEVR
jgi:hypothetical protein